MRTPATLLLTVALLLAACSGSVVETTFTTVGQPSASQPPSSLVLGDTTLGSGCFLTPAEVQAATGSALSRPPAGSFGPKGDASCQFYLVGDIPPGSFGCVCLGTNGPFDLQGQGIAWLDNLPTGGIEVPGIGDRAYMLTRSTASDSWAVQKQTGLHISISYHSLTADQFGELANAAFARLNP